MTNYNSSLITDLVSNPIDKRVKPNVIDGRLRTVKSWKTLDSANGEGALNDTVMMVRIPIGCTIKDVIFACDKLGAGTETGTADIGIYTATTDGVNVTTVFAGVFASAVNVKANAVAPTNYRYASLGLSTVNQEAWQIAGLSKAPDYAFFDIGIAFSEAINGAGNVMMEVSYTVD